MYLGNRGLAEILLTRSSIDTHNYDYPRLSISIDSGSIVQVKILLRIVITILCTVLVFQSTVVVILLGYSIYIQPVGTTSSSYDNCC